jgi:hypothetical protein
MDLCIVDYSVEIPTRPSFLIEFIIPKFLKAQHVSSGTSPIIRSSKLYDLMVTGRCQGWVGNGWMDAIHFPLNHGNKRHTAHHQELCLCSLWFTYACGVPTQTWLRAVTTWLQINQRLQIQFRAPDDERCATRNMLSLQKLLNNKFYYKAASYCYFYWVLMES